MSAPGLSLYRLAARTLKPAARWLLDNRARQGKEDPARLNERRGEASVARPDGRLVWIHAASVGESQMELTVCESLQISHPDAHVLITSGTLTSASLIAGRGLDRVIHQFPPVDSPDWVSAFLDHWRPDLAVFVESELWPNLLLEARRRGVALALVSARLTQATADRWARFPASARRVTAAFDLVMPQDKASAARLEAMGARVDGLANLKLAGDPLPIDKAAFSRLSAAVGDRPVIVAASTHEAEEAAIVRALDALPGRNCLILAPRHPERGPAIEAALRRDGYRLAVRSRGELPDGDTDLYLADTLNEMGVFLRLADVVVMGGSFAPALGLDAVGGHNPLEPARLARPAVTGPDASNWASVTEALVRAGGLAVVAAPSDLPGVIGPLLASPETAKAMGERARRAAAEANGGLDLLWGRLSALLSPAEARVR